MSQPNRLTGTFITYSNLYEPDEKGKRYKEKRITFDLADNDSVTGMGRLITPQACYQMIKEKFNQALNDDPLQKNFCGYLIGKEAILQLLAQEDCEGLMIIDCLNDQDTPSLVVAGVNKHEVLLKKEKYPIDDSEFLLQNEFADIPIIIERIGLRSAVDVMREMEPQVDPQKDNNEKATIFTNTFLRLDM